jgi:hypothetical protein
MSDDILDTQQAYVAAEDYSTTLERVQTRTNALGISTRSFSSAMTKAFADVIVGGKQFDDVLKSTGMQLSKMAVTQAFKPITSVFDKSLKGLLRELFPAIGEGDERRPRSEGGGCGCGCNCGGMGTAQGGCLKTGSGSIFDLLLPPLRLPQIATFATGGVIGAPSYFPMSGGLGLAGEAGPEAILPLSRGADGRLGIAGGGMSARSSITVQIATPDADSFRRSEAYVTGQIARAVARGQRGL